MTTHTDAMRYAGFHDNLPRLTYRELQVGDKIATPPLSETRRVRFSTLAAMAQRFASGDVVTVTATRLAAGGLFVISTDKGNFTVPAGVAETRILVKREQRQ